MFAIRRRRNRRIAGLLRAVLYQLGAPQRRSVAVHRLEGRLYRRRRLRRRKLPPFVPVRLSRAGAWKRSGRKSTSSTSPNHTLYQKLGFSAGRAVAQAVPVRRQVVEFPHPVAAEGRVSRGLIRPQEEPSHGTSRKHRKLSRTLGGGAPGPHRAEELDRSLTYRETQSGEPVRRRGGPARAGRRRPPADRRVPAQEHRRRMRGLRRDVCGQLFLEHRYQSAAAAQRQHSRPAANRR